MNFKIKHTIHDIPKEYNIRFRNLQSLKLSTYRKHIFDAEEEYFSNRYKFTTIYDLIGRLKNLVKIDIDLPYYLKKRLKRFFNLAIAHKIGDKIQDIKISWHGKRYDITTLDLQNAKLTLEWINNCKSIKNLCLEDVRESLFYMITNKLFPWQIIEKLVLIHEYQSKLLPCL